MGDNCMFLLNSLLLGLGLAMDAFSVSVANGLYNPDMKKKERVVMAGTYGFFQGMMPLVGWFCVHTISNIFDSFKKYIPVIALVLLLFIGGKMLLEGIRHSDDDEKSEQQKMTISLLVFQAIATSIDALSVGFTIADYSVMPAVLCAFIIAVITLVMCMVGVNLGRKFGMVLGRYAEIFGGLILIAIGFEIFLS